MGLRRLIERGKEGDLDAFTELVRCYQEMAFGYAFAILRDFHLAQDATQEAFVAAYFSLAKLEDPAKFPAWLRAIVRHQCSRLLRRRQVAVVPLDHAAVVPAADPGPDQQAEARDALEQVIAAITALPQPQREVTVLYYIEEYSQREIAAFLELPVTTVNTRLHAARMKLKGGLLAMARDAFERHGLPDDFATRVGTIIQARGPVVDARFTPDTLPPIFNALTITDQARRVDVTVEVAQHLGDDLVRGIVVSPADDATDVVRTGMQVVDTDHLIDRSVAQDTVQTVLTLLGRPPAGPATEILETGIKVIDLLCPYPKGGKVGFFGDPGVGKLVVIMELVRNLTGQPGDLTIFAFIRTADEVAHVRGTAGGLLPASPTVQAVYIPVEEPSTPMVGHVTSTLDATTWLTRAQADLRLWPAIDPLRSTSRCLDPALVGQEHYAVARDVRELLQRYQELQERVTATGQEQLSSAENTVIARARRVQRFLTQPLHVAAEFSNQPGQFVRREETVRAFAALLRGKYDDLPEEAFLMCGTLEQVVEKARAMTEPGA